MAAVNSDQTNLHMIRTAFLAALLLCPSLATAQLSVAVSPVKTTGQKAIVPLAMRNGFAEAIESARAVCFLLDDQGKMVGQVARWVIGGNRDRGPLPSGSTNAFNIVITTDKPLRTTNLTARLSFSRVVLEGGRLADVTREVTVRAATK